MDKVRPDRLPEPGATGARSSQVRHSHLPAHSAVAIVLVLVLSLTVVFASPGSAEPAPLGTVVAPPASPSGFTRSGGSAATPTATAPVSASVARPAETASAVARTQTPASVASVWTPPSTPPPTRSPARTALAFAVPTSYGPAPPTAIVSAAGAPSTAVPATSTAETAPTATALPVPTPVLAVTVVPGQASGWPGDAVGYTINVVNNTAVDMAVTLGATDGNPSAFSSSVSATSLTLGPGATAAVPLAVAISGSAAGELSNETTVTAATDAGAQATAKVTTRLQWPRFHRSMAGMGVSDRAVSPATEVEVLVGASPSAPFAAAVLADQFPASWKVLDAGGGAVTSGGYSQRIEWGLGDLAAGAVVTRSYKLLSPPPVAPAPEFYFASALGNPERNIVGNTAIVRLEHPLVLARYRVGSDSPLERMGYLAAESTPARGIARFQAFRVRFRVTNGQPAPVRWQPRLEWSSQPDAGFSAVPPGDSVAGQPFYVRPLQQINDGQSILAALFGLGLENRPPQDGSIFTRQNPGPVMTLNPSSYTEIEFSVRATADAAYGTGYYFRLSDGGRTMTGGPAAVLLEPSPVELSQPQFPGIYVAPEAVPALPSGTGPQSLGVDPQVAPSAPETLVQGMTASAAPLLGQQGATSFSSPHGPYTMVADQCARCHRSHTAASGNILPTPAPQSNVCFGCHDSSGSNKNISSQYSGIPANNPSTSSFYSHAATVVTTHTVAVNDEFKGVLNRHSECGDCHNSHASNSTLAASTPSGFTASGALRNVAGVSGTNTWKDAITYEYELCYKCHSSYTTLLSYTKESYKKLDKAVEFEPTNPSYHPIESAGKNNTPQMNNSLAGTSPYKLWNLTTGSVVRCTNCHGDYRLANPASPPALGARLAPHTSTYRGLLMNNLRDRVLKPKGEAYNAADSALCYQCHGEAPFKDKSGNLRSDSNFRFHGYHVIDIYGDPGNGGASTDIDTPGAGQGNAICSECHYRPHGQTTGARGNAGGTRLVNFAPNVSPSSSGRLEWNAGTGSCYLSCHGKDHNPKP